MAILKVDLGSNSDFTIDESNADASGGNIVNITELGDSTLTIDGVDVTINNIANISVGSEATFSVVNGGTLNLDQGLLAVNAITSTTFNVGDDSTINLDASEIDLGALNTILNGKYKVEFSGDDATGSFHYDPPTLSLLSGLAPITFEVDGMQKTDTFVVEGKKLSLDKKAFGGPESAYRNGVLHLETGGGLLTPKVHLEIAMTQEEADLFFSDVDEWLDDDTFTFPSSDAPCFARGTLILTDRGEIPIENICMGDFVMTRDHGAQMVRWVGSRNITAPLLRLMSNLLPVRIQAGALGDGVPARDLTVSPQHRILVRSRIAERMFGASEVLVAAKQFLQIDGIDIATDMKEVEYFHMLFDQHEVVFADGAETESLYTGPEALKSVGPSALREIVSIFPELQGYDGSVVPTPVRTIVSGRKGRKMAVRHMEKSRKLLDSKLNAT